MKSNQRGITNGWLYLIGLIALIVVATIAFKAWTSYTEGLYKSGFAAGEAKTKADYAQRDNAALTAANTEIQRLNTAARAAEQEHGKRVATLATNLDKEKRNGKAAYDRAIADFRAGKLVLLDHQGKPAGSAPAGSVSARAEAGAGAARGDEAAGCKLSGPASEFLLGEAARADDIAKQLAAAQTLIAEQIRTCNGP